MVIDYHLYNSAFRVSSFTERAVPPKNGVITLWPNPRVVKRKYYVSQKQIGFNDKIHWFSILLTFISKFTAELKYAYSVRGCGQITW